MIKRLKILKVNQNSLHALYEQFFCMIRFDLRIFSKLIKKNEHMLYMLTGKLL